MIIAQISDPHISLVAEFAEARAAQLQAAVAHLLRLPAAPDVVIITGDCADNGRIEEYQYLRELISPLTMPVYVIPGNHDNRVQMLEVFGTQGASPLAGFVQYAVNDWPVRLIALDTNIPGNSKGSLSIQQLDWLEQRLQEAPEQTTLIFMHHPPFKQGLNVLDDIGLIEANAFGSLIARYPQVERIVAGHVHVTMSHLFHGRLAMTCSALASQFLPDLNQPERLVVSVEPPSCLIHAWQSTTGLVSYTSLIGDHGPLKTIHDGTQWVA